MKGGSNLPKTFIIKAVISPKKRGFTIMFVTNVKVMNGVSKEVFTSKTTNIKNVVMDIFLLLSIAPACVN